MVNDMNHRKLSENPSYSAPIVSKAISVLKEIVSSPENQGISDIASRLSLAKSTTHGILTALEQSGWVLRDPISRKYTCGYAFKEMATEAHIRLPLVDLARPHLQGLGAKLNEDVFLGILSGTRILILDLIESSKELKVAKRPGTAIPVLAGAVGKIFLAYQDEEWVSNVLRDRPMPRFTPKSTTDPDRYIAALEEVREAGIALDVGEYIPNVWAMAVPVFHGSKNRTRMVAGFWVVGLDPTPSMDKIQTTEHFARLTGESLSLAVTEQGNAHE